MRCVPYYACCGAYFLCDIDEAAIKDKNIEESKLPTKQVKSDWDRYPRDIPDWSKAGVAFHIKQHPNIAYMFAILKPEEKHLGDMLCLLHQFKLISSTPNRLLYCRAR